MTPPAAQAYAEAPSRSGVRTLAPFRLPIEVGPAEAGFRAISPAESTRRFLNIVVALAGIIMTAPLMALIFVIVKLTSPGPALYTQTRVGVDRRQRGVPSGNHRRHIDYGGRLFRIYKFRTMRAGPTVEKQLWATPDDPRITSVGKVLRKYRLDELPQLFNVLRGDMNIVGPRPEQPEILIRLREQVEHYQSRQQVLPGITGWAQVNHHYDTSIDDVRRKVHLDLEYIGRRSALEDIRIMAKTIPVMVLRKGAI